MHYSLLASYVLFSNPDLAVLGTMGRFRYQSLPGSFSMCLETWLGCNPPPPHPLTPHPPPPPPRGELSKADGTYTHISACISAPRLVYACLRGKRALWNLKFSAQDIRNVNSTLFPNFSLNIPLIAIFGCMEPGGHKEMSSILGWPKAPS
jgi:hypothetical protein